MAFQTESERFRMISEEQARVRDMVNEFQASPEPLELRPMMAAEVFLHESIHAGGDAKDVKRCIVGAMILNASDEGRRLILLAILDALPTAPWEAPSWMPNVICNLRFVHDYHWGMLIKAILRSRPPANHEFVKGILEGLSKLTDRFNSQFPCNSYEFPFSNLVRYVDKQIPTCSVERFMPSIKRLLASIQKAVARDLVNLKGYSTSESKSYTKDLKRWFKKEDRTAIGLIEGWLEQ